MSYRIYTTPGIVLSHRDIGEANRLFFIYTRELGLVVATAQGIRYVKSKLRFGLQQYGYASVSLVRGRDIWRITTSAPKNPLVSLAKLSSEKRALMHSMHAFIERLVTGEEADSQLFFLLKDALSTLDTLKDDDQLRAFDILFKMRVMAHLGYIRHHREIEGLVASDAWTSDVIDEAHEHRERLSDELAYSLSEIQL